MAGPGLKLVRDTRGKGVLSFALGTCAVATAVAGSSESFETNPLLDSSIMELRNQLPETLDKITKAMGG